jgi:hypothetical protein
MTKEQPSRQLTQDLVVLGMPPPRRCEGRRTTVHKLLCGDWQSTWSALVRANVSVFAAAGRAVLVDTWRTVRSNRLGGVAPLAQWTHDRAVRLGEVEISRATRASTKGMANQESGDVASSNVRSF